MKEIVGSRDFILRLSHILPAIKAKCAEIDVADGRGFAHSGVGKHLGLRLSPLRDLLIPVLADTGWADDVPPLGFQRGPE